VRSQDEVTGSRLLAMSNGGGGLGGVAGDTSSDTVITADSGLFVSDTF
jgi:hypothetical protein